MSYVTLYQMAVAAGATTTAGRSLSTKSEAQQISWALEVLHTVESGTKRGDIARSNAAAKVKAAKEMETYAKKNYGVTISVSPDAASEWLPTSESNVRTIQSVALVFDKADGVQFLDNKGRLVFFAEVKTAVKNALRDMPTPDKGSKTDEVDWLIAKAATAEAAYASLLSVSAKADRKAKAEANPPKVKTPDDLLESIKALTLGLAKMGLSDADKTKAREYAQVLANIGAVKPNRIKGATVVTPKVEATV